ncbi:helix-turn-helix domain-containing protein [Myroides sp. 1354]|uniref:XRE family transcriptional regulator n=1 Tax=unclassified Myroides TaxID=2642485 RepID=UPI0025789D09|nr:MULTISPECIES: helix-turn-helix domain-containing protein [unclassified Myroides]MDM1045912.1 helix-turn-helix domain-containing protein [Myroides sp. R163-1]MDM1056922.1 helix-turn-helix domain-containing protein [Myroides sp. 1354]MDM1070117.1 helix-turn-helix domain-containing protein [Myroides sp. 1372]
MLKIKEIRLRKKITQNEMVVKTGIPKRSYVDYENEIQDISLERLRKIATALDVSVAELLGEEYYSNTIIEPVVSSRKTKDVFYEQQMVPIFNLEASMGLVPILNGDGIDEEKILDYISIPMMPSCDGAISATGDSMYPLLKAGDLVAYKSIAVERNSIFFGEMYLLAIRVDETTTMKTIKFVHPSELGNEFIKIVSHNQHHAPKDINLNQIVAMGLVRASIRIHN